MKEIKILHKLSEDARAVRQEVFVQEQGFQNEFDEIDESAIHCVCYVDGKPAAVGRAYRKAEGCFVIGRIAVRASMRKLGLGRLVVSALEEEVQKAGAKEVTLLSQLTAAGFYRTLGYTERGAVVYDEFCPHIEMQKKL